MKFYAKVRIRGGFGCVGIKGWYRTPRPDPYDPNKESWWISWVPETVCDELLEVVKGTTTRFRLGRREVLWRWLEWTE
jgi:hypothetical protein